MRKLLQAVALTILLSSTVGNAQAAEVFGINIGEKLTLPTCGSAAAVEGESCINPNSNIAEVPERLPVFIAPSVYTTQSRQTTVAQQFTSISLRKSSISTERDTVESIRYWILNTPGPQLKGIAAYLLATYGTDGTYTIQMPGSNGTRMTPSLEQTFWMQGTAPPSINNEDAVGAVRIIVTWNYPQYEIVAIVYQAQGKFYDVSVQVTSKL